MKIMNDDLRQQIYNNLNLEETDVLVGIWKLNDRVEWSDEAFSVLAEILKERLGDLPAQDEPVFEHPADDPYEGLSDAYKEKNIAEGNRPIFYRPSEVVRLIKWIKRIAGAYAFVSLWMLVPGLYKFISPYIDQNSPYVGYAWSMVFILITIFSLFSVLAIYLPFQGLRIILEILMEMEFNTRGFIINNKK